MSARANVVLLVAVLGCAGDERPVPVPGEPPATGPCLDDGEPGFATCVESFDPAQPASFGHDEMPDIVLGAAEPPTAGGSTDVASLGCGGSITLGFADAVPNRSGADLIVFENAFAAGDIVFIEPAVVRVSDDGREWFELACEAEAEGADGCAGVTPTRPEGDLRDPTQAGGDAFDLDDVGLERIHWVRVIDRTREHYGDDMWCMGAGGGFDLDAIARVHDP